MDAGGGVLFKHCGIIGMAGSSGAEPQGDCDWKTLHLNGYTAAEADTDKTGYCRQGRNRDGIGGHREIREIPNSTLLVHLGKNQIPANQTINRDFVCGRRDSNPYALRHQILSLAWLPITTRPQTMVCKDKDKILFCNIFHGRLSGAFPVAHMPRISVLAEIKAAPALHGVFPCQDKPCPGRRFCEHRLVICEEPAHEKHTSTSQ